MLFWFFIIGVMFLIHVIDDFHLQGWMAKAKQSEYWTQYGDMYHHDWVPVLILHGFEWVFLVSLPMFLTVGPYVPNWYFGLIIGMGLLHSYVDHLKANKFVINLWQDQLIHALQILLIAGIGIYYYGLSA